MSNLWVKPQDSVDLALLIESFGETIGTLYPVAYVYDPNNNLVSGSPFSLTLIGNNLYGLSGAFQASVNSGTYKVIYIVFTDAGHTTKSNQFGEKLDTITVSILSTTGIVGGGSGGDFYYDDTAIRQLIKGEIDKLHNKFEKLQKAFDVGLKIEIPEDVNTKAILSDIKLSILHSLKTNFRDVITAIKKNRSVIIKNKFDKKMMLPILENVANGREESRQAFDGYKIDTTKTIDLKINELNKSFSKTIASDTRKHVAKEMANQLKMFEELSNSLNEALRIKLKYTVDMLKSFIVGKTSKQNINITIKKDED